MRLVMRERSLTRLSRSRRGRLQHTTAFGSYLECLTVNRWLGQGWRTDGSGSQSSASLFLAKDPKVGV